MDKNAIKKYAVCARTELIARVSMKAEQYGIAEDIMVDASADSVNGKVLSAEEKKQRQALIAQIKDKGYRQVMEEVAYTWFNRFSALRFMEVNGYLPLMFVCSRMKKTGSSPRFLPKRSIWSLTDWIWRRFMP